MQNQNKPSKWKNRKFYVSLLLAAITFTIIGIAGVELNSGEKKAGNSQSAPENNNLADAGLSKNQPENTTGSPAITQPEQSLADASEHTPNSSPSPKTASDSTAGLPESHTNTQTASADSETDSSAAFAPSQLETNSDTVSPDSENTETEASVPTVNKSVISSTLSFDQEKGLLWPVIGDVILNYSMEKGIYYKTLGQYKCNPGILINAKPGTEIYSAADAIVEKIEKSDETGLTVHCSVGDDFHLIYGQLKKLTVKEGDTIKEGQTIGKLAKASRCFVLEGNHLFFEVLEGTTPVDPLLLLR